MTSYLVTYDLKETTPKPHRAFIQAAEKEGFLYVFQGTRDLFRLPNTTLWGEFASCDLATKAFDRAKAAAARSLGVTVYVEKNFFTSLDDWSVTSDRSKAPEARWTGYSKLETCRQHQLNDPYFAY
ncbi:hypothetical protein CA606_00745 [Caulobacter vibrioides]|uniref:Uncharacterized protein n=1 Tax=Caulobacter vibrioides TaxID=155892 RepID=A0A290MGP7_CAUVI|nr:hypothetical protein [Caulobacter vibrioides]ATC30990.1 hypothetical protein CA606_00745 [Caulobacter vibrioides]